MLKPRVGEIVVISSPLNFFTMVVFPALSRPLCNTIIHWNSWKKELGKSRRRKDGWWLVGERAITTTKDIDYGTETSE